MFRLTEKYLVYNQGWQMFGADINSVKVCCHVQQYFPVRKVPSAEHIFTQCATVIKVKNQFHPKSFVLQVVSYRLIATVESMTRTFLSIC